MTFTSAIVEDCEDISYVELLILHHTAKPIFKTNLMHELIDLYGDIIDHDLYLYGEYSDDIDEGIQTLIEIGALIYKQKIKRTEYGTTLYHCLMSERFACDPRVEDAIKRLKADLRGMLRP